MSAQVIDGKKIAQNIRFTLKEKIAELKAAPSLAVILVGNNPASEVYVKNKEKACHEVGINVQTFHLTEDIAEAELLELIETLNTSPDTNGILVQVPLPSHLNEQKVLQTITPLKDVDGFHAYNAGLLFKKEKTAVKPCTPKGIIRLLKETGIELTGLNAVVIGRSQIVGLPLALLLLEENCTVTVAHSKTKNLQALCQTADILIPAVGKPEFITKDYIKKGAVVIDVGINRTPQGLKGDVDYNSALEIAGFITPVPGGVGPMTIAMLLENTYDAFLKQQHS